MRRQSPSKQLFIRFLNRLVEKTGVIPDCMALTGIRRQGEYPVGGGGFADVWQGLFGSEVVALKVLRIFQRTSHRSLENTSRVSELPKKTPAISYLTTRNFGKNA